MLLTCASIKNNDRAAKTTLSLNRHLYKRGLVHHPARGSFKEAFKTASHVHCDCEALAALIFRHPGQHFLKLSLMTSLSVGCYTLFKVWGC
jgi:hypothetical protein